jgi:general nucleoside transport system ATP-binding protein
LKSNLCFNIFAITGNTVTKVLELKKITKRFPGVLACDHVDFDLQKGEIHALLGENGAGKTTLMNILYGFLHPDEGEIRVQGKICHIESPHIALTHGIGMVHQHFMLVPTMTVADNIVLGQEITNGPFLRQKETIKIIEELSIKYDLDVKPQHGIWQLSVGEQQRVEILKVLYRGAEILILDEPTATLTLQETEALFKILRTMAESGKSIIFISHKLEEVMQISDHITVLRRGKVIGTVNTHEINETDLACMMVGREVVLRVSRHDHEQETAEKKIAASLENISVAGRYNQLALTDITLDIYAGEILGVAGVDGNGQAELAELLAGLRQAQDGIISIQGKTVHDSDPCQRFDAGVSYIPAERKTHGAVLTLPIYINFVLKNHRCTPFSRQGIFDHRSIRSYAETQVREFDIRCPSIDAPAGTLSGGNLQKLILAREISANPTLLVAEQPTRGLDVGAIEYVRQLLLKQRDKGVAVLLISADLDEILAISDRVIVLYEGRIVFNQKNENLERENIGLAMAGQADLTD